MDKKVNWSEKIRKFIRNNTGGAAGSCVQSLPETSAGTAKIIETANVIWKYAEKYGLITMQMMKFVDQEVLTIDVFKIYDCLFLAQAITFNSKLITSDCIKGKT